MKQDPEDNGITNPTFYQEFKEDGRPQASALPQLTITRPHYRQGELNSAYGYYKPKRRLYKTVLDGVRPPADCRTCCQIVFPFLTWLPEYSWSRDLVGDLISGCTVAVMHIPQGIGYALLANVPPIIGIYMAFFPVLVYFLFGTSRHISMGTFAVVSIMVGKTVLKYSTAAEGEDPEYTPTEIATALCFVVAIIQLIMCVLRLGVISFLLSETLVSGFTTGAAIHVLTSQIKDLLGLSLQPVGSMFEVVKTFIEIGRQITNVNWAAVIISAVTIVILVVNNEYLKPKVAKRSIVPVPIELIAVISGTLLSRYLNFGEEYSVRTIGTIPTGLPAPSLPNFGVMSSLIVDSFTVAMVAYTVSVSMALIFAKKENYEIGFNQELFAMGAGNLVGSFFSCFPFATSLSRASIQYASGGRTQIASLISCTLLAIVLLWVGPFFEPLPKSVLAGIIVVALKGMLWQVGQLRQFWRQSKIDGLIWLLTFLSVVFFAIDIGLLVGVILSVCCIFFRALIPYTCLLGNVPNTDIYLDVNRYHGLLEHSGIKIFHYCGGLNFASRTVFKSTLCETLDINLTEEIKQRKSADYKPGFERELKYLILDFTALSYIDPSAISTFKAMISEFETLDIHVLLANCSPPVFETMAKCKLFGDTDQQHTRLYPSVHDAVLAAKDALAARMSDSTASNKTNETGVV